MDSILIEFSGVRGGWTMDFRRIDGDLVIFGFEEHALDDGGEQIFKTEQILDRIDLMLMKELIEKALGSGGSDD